MSKAPAVDYALQIFAYFTEAKTPQGISDIGTALDINKNAVSRILMAFQEYGWIYCSDPVSKKYTLTLKPFSMIARCVSGHSMVRTVEPFLQHLHQQLGDAVYLGVRHGDSVLYLLHYDSVKPVRVNGCVGGEYPLRTSAPGKVVLAFSDDIPVDFSEEAAQIRKQQFAIDNEEFAKGIICYAAPVYDATGAVVAAIGVSSLTILDTVESLIKEKGSLVSSCAAQISTALGYTN